MPPNAGPTEFFGSAHAWNPAFCICPSLCKGTASRCRYEKNVWWNRRGGNYNATKGEELEYFLETNGYEVRYFGVDEYVGKPESYLVKHYFGKCYG